MHLSLLLSLAALVTLPAPRPRAGDLEERKPAADTKPLEPYRWKSDGGLRFSWWLPKGYDGKTPRNLTVICHGTGLDYRWGGWNNKPGVFRPDDVVISVDGPTIDGETRLFLGKPKDADAMHDFIGELRKLFAVERVFLYGHSQGGFFVVYYAGEHPDDVAGVVAHASGAWNWSKTGKPVQKVAIAFMHGTADPVVPYGQSPGSRDYYAEQGFELLHLRRMNGYNHWPNAVRATEALDWCDAMTASDPAAVLAAAERMAKSKGPDEYQYEIAPDFSGARAALRRLEGAGPRPLKDVDPALLAKAKTLSAAIEAQAGEQVKALKKDMPKKLALDGKPWLGQLLCVREDFRGVDAVEAFLKEIDYDGLAKKQEKASARIFEAWYGKGSEKEIYETIVTNIGAAFLVDGYPPEMAEKVDGWHKDEKKLGASKSASKSYADFEKWKKSRDDGLKQYAKVWGEWK